MLLVTEKDVVLWDLKNGLYQKYLSQARDGLRIPGIEDLFYIIRMWMFSHIRLETTGATSVTGLEKQKKTKED